ncbi:MAG: cysteine--tRNA ligase [Candidatus Bathyarchaeota archaeon]|nr:MAG: cysteine--tRNA ligase [Candidatus Bathyarchaeota archaeon]
MTTDKPSGLMLYDTLTRSKRPFEPLEEGRAKLYVCGPTVYSHPHIGNFRTFTVGDILRRWLEYRGYDVFHVMNITDIEDKTIRDSGKEGIPLKELTDRYTASFLRGLDRLNIRRATVYPVATEYVPQMIEFVQALLDKGVAYVASDGVYFDIDKFPNYGKLSGVDTSKVESTERMADDEYDKEAANDFAVWKFATKDELDRRIYYESPWGKGRPGWHIECSVMNRCLMGDTIDIHAGGEDLTFPHHENEIAQSESLTEKQFVMYWLHARFLMMNGRKMSKSLGNYVSFDEVLSNYSREALRYFYLSVHYRRPLDYTDESMKIAENSVARLGNTLDLIDDALKGPDVNLDYAETEESFIEAVYRHRNGFEDSMDDDLDTHGAIDALHAMSRAINEYISGAPNKGVMLKAASTYRGLLNALGLFEQRTTAANELTEDVLSILADVRDQLRSEKQYQLSDKIRDDLARIGVTLSDTSEGTKWKIDNP